MKMTKQEHEACVQSVFTAHECFAMLSAIGSYLKMLHASADPTEPLAKSLIEQLLSALAKVLGGMPEQYRHLAIEQLKERGIDVAMNEIKEEERIPVGVTLQ